MKKINTTVAYESLGLKSRESIPNLESELQKDYIKEVTLLFPFERDASNLIKINLPEYFIYQSILLFK